MAVRSSISGVLVAVTGRDYDRFQGQDGEWVDGGRIHELFVVTEFDRMPVRIKASNSKIEKVAPFVDEKNFGERVVVSCYVNALVRGNRAVQEYSLDSIERVVKPQRATA